jgi:hypothetical protein
MHRADRAFLIMAMIYACTVITALILLRPL